MKSRLFTILIVLSSLIFISTSGYAFLNSDVKKAKEFMAAGMFPQAIELLKKRINDKPTDAEAHYTLGVCYINTGNFSQAVERFASAVRLEPDYGFKIGGDFKKAGDDALSRGDLGRAESSYRQAVKYQPNLRNNIADGAYQKGNGLFDQKNYGSSYPYFIIAGIFSPNYKSDIGKRFVELSKQDGISKEEANKYKSQASEFLSKAEMNEAFPPPPPDFIVYQRGEHTINLKAGEITKKWITFPDDVRIGIDSKDYKYKFHYPNGDVLNAWELKIMPSRYKFKIEAITDQNLILRVK